MTHDYKAAYMDFCHNDGCTLEVTDEAIRTALRIADKLMQEPSEKVVEAGGQLDGTHYGIDNLSDLFKAMRDQILKEAQHETP